MNTTLTLSDINYILSIIFYSSAIAFTFIAILSILIKKDDYRELNELKKQKWKLLQEKETLLGKIEDLEKSYDNSQIEKEHYARESKKTRAINNNLKQYNDDLIQENFNLQRELNKTAQQLALADIEGMEQEISELRIDLKELQQQWNEADIEGLEQENFELKEEQKEAELLIIDASKIIKALIAENKQLRKNVNDKKTGKSKKASNQK